MNMWAKYSFDGVKYSVVKTTRIASSTSPDCVKHMNHLSLDFSSLSSPPWLLFLVASSTLGIKFARNWGCAKHRSIACQVVMQFVWAFCHFQC